VIAALVACVATMATCGGGAVNPPHTPVPTPTPAPVPTPRTGKWTLVFADDFDVDGAPDPTRWAYDTGYIANNEAQYYTTRRENVRVENGVLVLEARKEEWEGYHYTSGRIKTQGLFEFTYGRVEVRAKLPTGRGTWPAIWMLGANIGRVGWPACGEIDIMENVGYDPLTVVASVHTTAYNHSLGTQRSASIQAPPPWEDFHTYSVEWQPDRIEVAFDGEVYFTFQNELTGVRTWPFYEPAFMILNLAVGGTWGGAQGIDDSLFPHRHEIDYVRVYQLQ